MEGENIQPDLNKKSKWAVTYFYNLTSDLYKPGYSNFFCDINKITNDC